jgi:uncharacterized protein involved in exopolysaccharide biosynthesis
MRTESTGRTIRALLQHEFASPRPLLDYKAVRHFVGRFWILLGVFGVIGGAVGYGISFAFPKQYRTQVLLAPTTSNSESGGGIQGLVSKYSALASAVGIGLPAQQGLISVAIARLQSRGFIEGFIADQKIMEVLFPKDFSSSVTAGEAKHTLQDGFQKFVGSVMLVERDKSSDLVTIRIDWTDRELGAKWANALVSRLNDVMRADAMDETDRNLKYLAVELQKAEYVTLRDAIASVMESQINKRMLAITQPEYAFRILDPAKPSDAKRKQFPKRWIFLIVGGLLAGLLGIVLCLRREAKQNRTLSQPAPSA